MGSIEDNKRVWDGEHNWNSKGDEWSVSWGGTSMQWYGTLLPRIHYYVPTNCILEIACGYGRWTQYLKDLCKHLIIIDLSEECIKACKQRFAYSQNIKYFVTDGKSLNMVPDRSVNFIFSFDSLVHADGSVLDAYIRQFNRILTDRGVAFIHHSNLGEYNDVYSKFQTVRKLAGLLRRLGVDHLDRLGALTEKVGWRDRGVDAEKVVMFAEQNGLRCITQEIIPWGRNRERHFLMMMMDCISTITKNAGSTTKSIVFRNYKFYEEVDNCLRLSKLYTNPNLG